MTKKKLNKKKERLRNEISLLELKQTKQAYKKSLNSGKFSKRIIFFCILYTAIFALICLYVQYKTGYNTHYLLSIVAAVFGGELLLLLFKRIYSTDDNKFTTFISKFKNKSSKSRNEKISSVANSVTISNSKLSDQITDTVKEINSSIGGLG